MTLVERVLVVLTGLVGLAALVGVGDWWWADRHYAQGKSLADLGYLEEGKILLERATRWWPWEPAYWRALAEVDADLAGAFDAEGRDFLMAADTAARRALALNPANLLTRKSLIHTYLILATLDAHYGPQLETLVQQAIDLCPTDPILWYYQALDLARRGQLEAAERSLDQALTLKPDYQAALSLREKLLAGED